MLFRLTPHERRSLCALLFAVSVLFLSLFFYAPPSRAAEVPEENIVDVAILYTANARAVHGSEDGFRAALNAMFESANEAYRASGITARLRLVGAKITSHTEETYYDDDLYSLTGVVFDEKGDGYVIDDPESQSALCREGIAFREERRADLVCLLRQGADSAGTAGLAWLNGSYFHGDDESQHVFERLGYSVVGIDFIGIHAFPHEIGHNLGCAHDRYTDNASSPATRNKVTGHFAYSYGYKPSSSMNQWGTVMSYTNNRILLYSSPDLRYNGLPAGVAQNENYSADNVSTLKHTIPHAVAFRELPATTIQFSPSPAIAVPGSEPVPVSLSSPRPDYVIRYTLDGSNVSEKSAIYTQPINVPRDVKITARAYRLADNTPAESLATATYAPGGERGQVAPPVFNRSGGTYDDSVLVSFAPMPDGVTIRYTLDGAAPSESSALYSAPVKIARDSTVRARAYFQGLEPSNIVSEAYSIRILAPVFSPNSVTFGSSLDVAISAAPETAIFYTTDGSAPSTAADGISQLYASPIAVRETTTLQAIAFREGCAPSAISRATYTQLISMSDAPIFANATGAYENQAMLAFDAPKVAGTIIRYTLDGSEPNATSAIYAAPLPILRDTTVRARAFSPELAPSIVASANYTIRLTPPEITPQSGTFTGYVYATISAVPQTEIRYAFTNNYAVGGEFPESTLTGTYTTPLQFTNSGRLTARAYRDGCSPSEETSATYTISAAPKTAAPVFAPPPCADDGSVIKYTTAISVAISCQSPGAEIRYTTDDSAPSPSSPLYSAPLTLDKDTVLRARAFHPSYSPGTETRGEYHIWTQTGERPPEPADEVSYTTDSPNPQATRPNDYYAVLSVRPNCKTTGAVVRYTLDGSEVSENSPAVESEIRLDRTAVHTAPESPAAAAAPPQTVTLRLRAYALNFLPGKETVATFTDATVAPWMLFHPASRTKDLGESITFTTVVRAAPAPSYQWYKNGVAISGAIRPSYSIARIKKTDVGSYHVVVSNLAGSITSQTAELSLREPSGGNTDSGDNTGDSGSDNNGDSSGGGDLTPDPDPDGGDSGNNNGTPPPETPVPPSIVRFHATFSDEDTAAAGFENDSASPSVANFLVRLWGEFSEFIAIAPGKSPTLRLEYLSNSVSTSFTWLRNGTALATTEQPAQTDANAAVDGKRFAEFTPDPAALANGDTLQVRVNNPAGAATSQSLSVLIAREPEIQFDPPPASIRAGQTLRLEAKTVADPLAPFLRYTWRKDGQVIPNAVLPTFVRENAAPADAGNYTVTAISPTGQTATASASVVIEP